MSVEAVVEKSGTRDAWNDVSLLQDLRVYKCTICNVLGLNEWLPSALKAGTTEDDWVCRR